MVKVAVVILNWNGKDLLEKFLPSLIRFTPAEFEIVLGDNASTDDSLSFVENYYPTIRCIVNEVNLGYAEGYNKILEKIEATYFILLNSDVEVSENWILPIIDYLDQHPTVVAAQPKIMDFNKPESFEYAGAAGGFMDSLGYFFCQGRIFNTLEKDEGQYNYIRNIFWASGAAFFVRSKNFKEVGGFDARLFAHMEEIDLCWRFQNIGMQIAYIPNSRIYHMGGQTLAVINARKTYLNFRNNLIIYYKNLVSPCRTLLLCLRFFLDFIAWLKFIVLLKWDHALAINRAHIDFLRMKKDFKTSRTQSLIPTCRLDGIYPESIVANYFLFGRKKFSDLVFSNSKPNKKAE